MKNATDYTIIGQVKRLMHESIDKEAEVIASSITNHKTGEEVAHKTITMSVSKLNEEFFKTLKFYTRTGMRRQIIIGFYGCVNKIS